VQGAADRAAALANAPDLAGQPAGSVPAIDEQVFVTGLPGAEASLPVADLLRWITQADPETVQSLLAGCLLDDGDSNAVIAISGVIVSDRALLLADGRRVLLRKVPDGAIVDPRPGAPLLAAYADARSPAEQAEGVERSALRRLGVDPDRLGSAADRHAVLIFLRAQETGETIAEPALAAFYEAMKRSPDAAMHRRAAAALRTLAGDRHGGDPRLVSLLWRLAWFLNRTGQYEEAIALSETPAALDLQGMHRAYMASIRASALIALGGLRRDTNLLKKAEQSIRTALAAGSAPEIADSLYGALRRARERIGAR